jgi:ribosomal silencing factor RsfS
MENEKIQAEQARLLAEAAVNALEDKKGMDVRLIPVGAQTALADYFVIATATDEDAGDHSDSQQKREKFLHFSYLRK